MTSVDDQVQKLFDEYQNKVKKNRIEDPEDDEYRGTLDEIQTLRGIWDHHGWGWEQRHLDRKVKRSYYLKMFEQVRNKLAMKTETATEADFWWTAPHHEEIVNLLWSIAATLRKRALLWSRHIPMVTYVIVQRLLYLGILVALLLFSRNTFETKVIASLIRFYNIVTLQGIDLSVDLVHLRKTSLVMSLA